MLEITHEEAEGYFSASRINTYLICPNKYLFNYIEKHKRETVSAPLMFGIATHSVIEKVYDRIRTGGPAMSREEVADEAASSWVRTIEKSFEDAERGVSYGEKESEGQLKDRLIALLRLFVDQFEMPSQVHALEQKFRCWVYDPKTNERRETQFVGVVDAIVTRDGAQIIEEHKTSGRRWSKHDYQHNIQGSLYLAAHQMDRLNFNVLTQRKNPCIETFNITSNDWQKTDAINVLCRVMDAVEQQHFFPKRGWQCDRCSFKRRCFTGR